MTPQPHHIEYDMRSLSTRKDPPMRAFSTVIAALGLCALTGCVASPTRLDGQASPAGITTPAVSAAPSTATAPPVATSPSPSRDGTPDPVPGRTGTTSVIRGTDWPDVNLRGVSFLDLGDLRFRGGEVTAGTSRCVMLPGGARPAYGEYLTEEPADSPVTEDALVLVECGQEENANGAGGNERVQALVLVQLGHDQKTRNARGHIRADDAMTFLSYRIDGEDIVTGVRTAGGRTENRRYRFAGGSTWERV
jgi:hypothetical protein